MTWRQAEFRFANRKMEADSDAADMRYRACGQAIDSSEA